ncbi:MAG: alkaline phosphatase family protein [Clostridium sp.]
MKTIMVIIDGAEPLDYRFCENIKSIKYCKKVNNTPDKMKTNSLTCIMNLLKVPKEYIPKGRAYLEALSMNEEVNEEDLILRCNNVNINNHILISSCKEENNLKYKSSINLYNKFKFIPMDSYKNLLIIKNGYKNLDYIKTYPPHENLGKNIYEIMPKCSNKSIEEDLKKLILDFNLYPWGESKKQKIPSFYAIHKLKGAVVCKTEIVKGIGMAMGMYCPKIDKVTSDIDTNLKNKRDCALKLIKDYDFVLLHINGADEAGHRKNKKEKEEFIKRIDREVIKFLKEKDFNLIVTSDHGTSCESGKHINGLVNFYMTNKEGEKWLR